MFLTANKNANKAHPSKLWRRLSRFFWLSIRCCPDHHKKLFHIIPWDQPFYKIPWRSPKAMYGFCCEGTKIWPVGLRNLIHLDHPVGQKKGQFEPLLAPGFKNAEARLQTKNNSLFYL